MGGIMLLAIGVVIGILIGVRLATAEKSGNDAVPDYWRSYLETKAEEINVALEEAGNDKSAFLWYTDAHWTTNYGQSPVLLKYLSEHTGIQKTFFGGDIAQETSGEIRILTEWQKLVEEVPNHHSVIGNHDVQVSELPDAKSWGEFFIAPEQSGDVVYGTDEGNGGTYYYIDNQQEKTRYICLSTGRMWSYRDEMVWCVEVLNSTPKNWHIVIVSHLWRNNDYENGGILRENEDYTQAYFDLFDAYNRRESGKTSVNGVVYDFAGAGAKIEFLIGGHGHKDHDFTTLRGIPVILTESDAWQERDDESVAEQGTITENCVYAIVADYANKQIRIINVGRGSTRMVAIPDDSEYVNRLLMSTNPDGTLYGGLGYESDTRLSVSSGVFEERNETGWCATGLIPAKAGDVIRLKNCVFTISTTAPTHRGGIFAADEKGDYTGLMVLVAEFTKMETVQYADGDNVVEFTLPTWFNGSHLRIVAQEFTLESVITVNEEIE